MVSNSNIEISVEIKHFNDRQSNEEKLICIFLMETITRLLPEAENKLWHAHPVWFLDGNPIVGYNKLKDCIRLLFWSGQSFNELRLSSCGSFKAAEIRYTNLNQIEISDLEQWLYKSKQFQWDYKNIYKTKGVLNPLIGVKK